MRAAGRRGLINLRGQIVTAIDMRRRLGLPSVGDTALPMNVVVRATEGVVSLLVDEIGDVVEVEPSQLETPPDTLAASVRAVVTGIYKLPERLLLVADVEAVAAVDAVAD
ncbi:MAG: chemotaxis protein CheW [Vicinamibacterales bacterium]